MAHIVADRIRDTTTTTGTGAVTVSGTPPATYLTFSARCAVSDTLAYFIAHQSADEWECGVGTYSASNTLTRTTVLSSSNSDAAVTFSAGTKDVVLTQVADRGYQKSGLTFSQANGSINFAGNSNILGDATNGVNILATSTAQSFRVYNTTDSNTSPTNYERGVFDWTTTANTLTIGSQKGGTGSQRNVAIVCGTGTLTTDAQTFIIDSTSAFSGNGFRMGSSGNRGMNAVNNGVGLLNGVGAYFFANQGGTSGQSVAFYPTGNVGWAASGDASQAVDVGFNRNAAAVVEINNGTAGTYRELILRSVIHSGVTVANLPGSPTAGQVAYVTDATATTIGSTVAGTGSNKVLVWYNGTAWHIAAN